MAVSLLNESTVIAGGFTNTRSSISQRRNDTAALSLPSPVPISFPGTKLSIFTSTLPRGQALTVSPDGGDLSVSLAGAPCKQPFEQYLCFSKENVLMKKKIVLAGVQVSGAVSNGSDPRGAELPLHGRNCRPKIRKKYF